MLNVLLKACSEGNLQTVIDLLRDVNPNDIEVKGKSSAILSRSQHPQSINNSHSFHLLI